MILTKTDPDYYNYTSSYTLLCKLRTSTYARPPSVSIVCNNIIKLRKENIISFVSRPNDYVRGLCNTINEHLRVYLYYDVHNIIIILYHDDTTFTVIPVYPTRIHNIRQTYTAYIMCTSIMNITQYCCNVVYNTYIVYLHSVRFVRYRWEYELYNVRRKR